MPLEESYRHCHAVMRAAARNFYFGMKLLPPAKRRSMHALYAFNRHIDDLTDEEISPVRSVGPRQVVHSDRTGSVAALRTAEGIPTVRRRAVRDASEDGCIAPALLRTLQPSNAPSQIAVLEHWRTLTHAAVAGSAAAESAHPLLSALADTVRRYGIPLQVLDDAIDGQIQDLRQNCYTTFDELYRYCYRVASTVGIAAVHIWGFKDPRAIKLAEELGIAMQLTNILRDLKEDAGRGRQYLPSEDYARFGVDATSVAAVSRPRNSDSGESGPASWQAFIRFEAERAASYYDRAAELEALIEPDARPTLAVMTSIYRGILNRIAVHPELVLVRRVGLGTMEKLMLVARHAWTGMLRRGG